MCLYGGGAVLDVKRDFLETIAHCHQIAPDRSARRAALRRIAREILRIFRAADVVFSHAKSAGRDSSRPARRMLTKSTDWQSVEKACKPRKLYLHPRELTWT